MDIQRAETVCKDSFAEGVEHGIGIGAVSHVAELGLRNARNVLDRSIFEIAEAIPNRITAVEEDGDNAVAVLNLDAAVLVKAEDKQKAEGRYCQQLARLPHIYLHWCLSAWGTQP